VAWTEGVGYNGSRNVFFCGEPTGEGMYEDGSGLHSTTFVEDPTKGGPRVVYECPCPTSDLILAPEDGFVRG